MRGARVLRKIRVCPSRKYGSRVFIPLSSFVRSTVKSSLSGVSMVMIIYSDPATLEASLVTKKVVLITFSRISWAFTS